MVPGLPFWLRSILGVHRMTLALERATREALHAAAWAFTPAGRRDAVTRAVYARLQGYRPGGPIFQRGLQGFEEHALGLPAFPRRGRILLGGAGGGREARVLLERGYGVRAFEPVPVLAEACVDVCRSGDGACLVGDYADLARAAREGQGPLSALAQEAPFDAVVLGWGSLAHVIEPLEVDAVFESARRLAPDGPLFTNFYPRAAPGRAERAGASLDRLFRALGAPGRRPPGGIFAPNGGFALTYSLAELAAVAARHGYEICASDASPPAWVLFLPGRAPRG